MDTQQWLKREYPRHVLAAKYFPADPIQPVVYVGVPCVSGSCSTGAFFRFFGGNVELRWVEHSLEVKEIWAHTWCRSGPHSLGRCVKKELVGEIPENLVRLQFRMGTDEDGDEVEHDVIVPKEQKATLDEMLRQRQAADEFLDKILAS